MQADIYSIATTQLLLGEISRQTVYNLIAAGRLKRVNLGRRAFITAASVEKLLIDMSVEVSR